LEEVLWHAPFVLDDSQGVRMSDQKAHGFEGGVAVDRRDEVIPGYFEEEDAL
jgi:hypothetical protein